MARVDMRKLGVVFKREYLERIRSKWFLIGTLLGPVFLGVIMVLPAYLSVKQRPADDLANVIVLDATGSGFGARVATALRKNYPNSPPPQVRTVSPERLGVAEDSAVNAVVRKEVYGFIVLGSRLDIRQTGSDTASFASGKTIIHVDCEPGEVNNRIKGCIAIHADLAHKWTVGELAKLSNLSRSAFAGRFLGIVGQPPMAYLAAWRLDRAAEMLRYGRWPVSEVADRVGYTSQAVFSRAFKGQFAMSPLQWRQRDPSQSVNL